MDIIQSTRAYESWARGQIEIVEADLKLKHAAMAKASFPFLRATFYRWSQVWVEACPDLAAAPGLLAVGDLHVENFGTWRDAEGRLVWGINDFDEAAPMSYAIDLVRLATSALLARDDNGLAIAPVDACAAILKGYGAVIEGGGAPFVLEEKHPKLRALALGAERDPAKFWAKTKSWKLQKTVPKRVRALIGGQLPADAHLDAIVHRVAGLGSLGRRRYVGLADVDGGRVAREAKEMMSSAYRWARGKKTGRIRYNEIMARAVRCRDPFVHLEGDWLLRRIGPHCSRIELADLPKERDERILLEQMGRETANIHLGAPDAIAAVTRDFNARKSGWLLAAAQTMANATVRDWKRWKASH
jgi:uncharacterized protein (DUF2252 family)